MKRILSIALALMLMLGNMPLVMAEESVKVPEFSSYSEGAFSLVGKQEYDICVLYSYEAPYTAETKQELMDLMVEYVLSFQERSFSRIDHHYAEYDGYLQDSIWFRYEGDTKVTPFGFQMQDYKVNSCDLFFDTRVSDEKIVLDCYFALETEVVDASVFKPQPYGPMPAIADDNEDEPLEEERPTGLNGILPSFEAFAGDVLVDRMGKIYTLRADQGMQVVNAYCQLLEAFGFSQMKQQQVNGLNCIWFPENAQVKDAQKIRLAQGRLQADACLYFVVSSGADKLIVNLTYSDAFTEDDLGDRYEAQENNDRIVINGMTIEGVENIVVVQDEKIQIPSFAAYAKGALINSKTSNGVTYYVFREKDQAIIEGYARILEKYGLSNLYETRLEPKYFLITQYNFDDVDALKMKDGNRSIPYFIRFHKQQLNSAFFQVSVEYMDLFNPVDTGERWVTPN